MSNKFKDKKAKLQKKSSSSGSLIAIIVIVIGVVAIGGYLILGGGKGGSSDNKYLGRYLPDGYESPVIAQSQNYTAPVEMVDVKNTVNNGNLEISLKDILDNKNVLTKYEKKKVESSVGTIGLPIMAMIKPSGKLFVAVSFCPPCRGVKHTIALDGTRVCNTCGTRHDLETAEGVSGPCKLYPQDELPVKVIGDKVLIAEDVLSNWSSQPIDRPVGGQ